MADKIRQSSLIHEELEPRLLFSAGAEAVLLDNNQFDSEPAIVETVSESEIEILQLEQNQQTNAESEPAREVVFIDESVDNYDQLMADLANKANTDVYILDTAEDGLDQITAVLANYEGLDAVHLVSHGDDASLLLGNSTLDNNSIESYSNAISGWQSALSEDADLLIYGCDVASSAEGQGLVTNLQALTGADVAASNDITGNANFGGDWDLEYHAGDIETSVIFSTTIQQNWQGTLPAPNMTNINGDNISYQEGSDAQIIDQNSDASANEGAWWNDAKSLTVNITAGGDTTEDVLSIANVGGISYDSTSQEVSYSGVKLGDVSGGSDGNALVITFNNTADDTNIGALLSAINYENTDISNATTGDRTVAFTLTNDSGASTDTATVSVVNTDINTAPASANNTVAIKEDTAYTFSGADFKFTDPDMGDSLVSITVTSLESVGSLQLNGVDVALNDTISKADIDAGKLSFVPAANANGTGHDSFSFSVNDGTTDSASSYTMTIDVTAVNDAPLNVVPGDQTTDANSTLIFSAANGNAISINDVDANGDGLKVKLTVSDGTLSLNDTTGLSFLQGDGADDKIMTFTGSIDAINAALDGLGYSSENIGDANLTIITKDIGNTGAIGGNKTDTAHVRITTATAESTIEPLTPIVTDTTEIEKTVWIDPGIETVVAADPDKETEEQLVAVDNSEEKTQQPDVVIDIDANGKATIQLNQGSGELLNALMNNSSTTDTDNVSVVSSNDIVNGQNSTVNSITPWNLDSDLSNTDMEMALDQLNQHLGDEAYATQDGGRVIVTTAAGVTVALTAGFVSLAIQSGSVMTAFMMVMPSWNTFDPRAGMDAKGNNIDIIDSVFDNVAPVTSN